MAFKLIGLWLGDNEPDWPDVTRFSDSADEESRREELARQLDSGDRTDRAYMGYSKCRLCGCRNGSGERTDGVFIWPEGLAHYVRDHAVRLPEVIENHLLGSGSIETDLVRRAIRASNEERDVTWWRQVTAEGRTGTEVDNAADLRP
ncbi:MAG TPA: hypothetical protein VEJ84_08040 [Acidimicrobiales bacterium]|nr:hypothetical protein [Acidimicrobiales bacterium]